MKDLKETEKATIGLMLRDPSLVATAIGQGLTADWFADDTCHVVWLAMRGMFDGGKLHSGDEENGTQSDAVAVWEETRKLAENEKIQKKFSPRVDWPWFLEAIRSEVSSAYLEHHLADLRDGWMERTVRKAGLHFSKQVNGGADTMTCVLELQKRIEDMLKGVEFHKKTSLASVMRGILTEYETAYQRRVVEKDLNWTPGYRWPWSPMTNLMNGLEPGLGIVAARPSVGKTLFALNLIRFWCDMGINVCFNSLDMEQRSLIRRFIAERSRVSIKKAKYTPTGHDLKAMGEAISAMENWPLDFVEIRDVEAFAAHVKIEQSKGRAQIVVVDYLGLMQSARVDNANEYARVSYVSDRLKEIANTLRLPVIALCQLNREVAKSETGRLPTLADLRGSGSIEQDAFWVAFLHRDTIVQGNWKATPPLQLVPKAAQYPATLAALDPVHFVVAKSQNGECGSLPFVFRKNYLTCQMGDYTAQPETKSTGYGAAAKTYQDNSARFAKVCTDWRHDPVEAALRGQGALIDLPDCIETAKEAADETDAAQADMQF